MLNDELKSSFRRNALSVDSKNLDADAELRRFFGSKVVGVFVASTCQAHHDCRSPHLLNQVLIVIAQRLLQSFDIPSPSPNPAILLQHLSLDSECANLRTKRWMSCTSGEGLSWWMRGRSGLLSSIRDRGERWKGSSWELFDLMARHVHRDLWGSS